MKTTLFPFLMVVGSFVSIAQQGLYLGQNPPGDSPALFAPGIVNTGMFTRDIAMTPDGNEIYYCVSPGAYRQAGVIMMTKRVEGTWTTPAVLSCITDLRYWYGEPFITPDGQRMFFASNRPAVEGSAEDDYGIWVMDRTARGWSAPVPMGSPVNSTKDEYFATATSEGTIYFTREETDRTNNIYRSRCVDGTYGTAEKLPPQVNCGSNRFNAFISPDESFIIVCVVGRPDSKGSTDYYVVFRETDDSWSEPINLGNQINTPGGVEYSPYVSPDGKYFFFMSSRMNEDLFGGERPLGLERLREIHNTPGNGNACIYWMNASVITRLRPRR